MRARFDPAVCPCGRFAMVQADGRRHRPVPIAARVRRGVALDSARLVGGGGSKQSDAVRKRRGDAGAAQWCDRGCGVRFAQRNGCPGVARRSDLEASADIAVANFDLAAADTLSECMPYGAAWNAARSVHDHQVRKIGKRKRWHPPLAPLRPSPLNQRFRWGPWGRASGFPLRGGLAQQHRPSVPGVRT